MNFDSIIGRLLFTEGIVRPVFRDGGSNQCVIDLGGHARRCGIRLRLEDADVPPPLVVPASEAP